jgi:hypothetical protein
MPQSRRRPEPAIEAPVFESARVGRIAGTTLPNRKPALQVMESLHLPWHVYCGHELCHRNADLRIGMSRRIHEPVRRSAFRSVEILPIFDDAHWDHEPDRWERRSPNRRESLAEVNVPNWNSAFRFMERTPRTLGAPCVLERRASCSFRTRSRAMSPVGTRCRASRRTGLLSGAALRRMDSSVLPGPCKATTDL